MIAHARDHLGAVLCLRGALDEALVVEREALEVVAGGMDTRAECWAHTYLARIHLARSEPSADAEDRLHLLEHHPVRARLRAVAALSRSP